MTGFYFFSFSFNRRYTQSDYMIQSNFKNQSTRPYYQYYLSQESGHLLKKNNPRVCKLYV